MKTLAKVLGGIVITGGVVVLTMWITSKCLDMKFVDYCNKCVWPGLKMMFTAVK